MKNPRKVGSQRFDNHPSNGFKRPDNAECPAEELPRDRQESTVSLEKLGPFLSDPRQPEPCDREDAEKRAEERRVALDSLRRTLTYLIGCRNTFNLMMSVYAGRIKQIQIAKELGQNPSKTSRDLKSIRDRIRKGLEDND